MVDVAIMAFSLLCMASVLTCCCVVPSLWFDSPLRVGPNRLLGQKLEGQIETGEKGRPPWFFALARKSHIEIFHSVGSSMGAAPHPTKSKNHPRYNQQFQRTKSTTNLQSVQCVSFLELIHGKQVNFNVDPDSK